MIYYILNKRYRSKNLRIYILYNNTLNSIFMEDIMEALKKVFKSIGKGIDSTFDALQTIGWCCAFLYLLCTGIYLLYEWIFG